MASATPSVDGDFAGEGKKRRKSALERKLMRWNRKLPLSNWIHLATC